MRRKDKKKQIGFTTSKEHWKTHNLGHRFMNFFSILQYMYKNSLIENTSSAFSCFFCHLTKMNFKLHLKQNINCSFWDLFELSMKKFHHCCFHVKLQEKDIECINKGKFCASSHLNNRMLLDYEMLHDQQKSYYADLRFLV